MEKVRAYWFSELLRDRFKDDRKAFMDATGLSKGRITQLKKKGFGDVAARNLLGRLADKGYKLPGDYFDRPLPPEDAAPSSVISFTARQMPLLEAFEVFAFALNKLPPGKRRKVIDALADYAADLGDEVERQYAIGVLLGEPPKQQARRTQSP